MGGLGSTILGSLPPCEGILTAQIVTTFYEAQPEDMISRNSIYILNFLTLGAGALLGNIMSGIGFSVSGYRLTRRMRQSVFEAMVRRDMGWFDFPEHSTGELTTRLEADAEAVAKVTGKSCNMTYHNFYYIYSDTYPHTLLRHAPLLYRLGIGISSQSDSHFGGRHYHCSGFRLAGRPCSTSLCSFDPGRCHHPKDVYVEAFHKR